MGDNQPFAPTGAAKSDAPVYNEGANNEGPGPLPSWRGSDPRRTGSDTYRRLRESVDTVQREAQSFFEKVHDSDDVALKENLGLLYTVNVVLIAAAAALVFFHDVMTQRAMLVGSVTSCVLGVCFVMLAHERNLQTYNFAQVVEKYCLLLATVPGRMGLVLVLGMLVVSCNWLGWIAFWVSVIDAVAMGYVLHTHPWFKEHKDDPILFRKRPTLPAEDAREYRNEIAE